MIYAARSNFDAIWSNTQSMHGGWVEDIFELRALRNDVKFHIVLSMDKFGDRNKISW